ncbi:GGDEF domain-containing protein [Qipengyuania marisflavi]|nr:diguanylate cyclase [Qipengyuania marisflavi]
MRILTRLYKLVRPHVPAHIRDEFAIVAADLLRAQGRLMFFGFLVSIPVGIAAASENAGPFIGVGLPLLLAAICVVGLGITLRDSTPHEKLASSQSLLTKTWIWCSILSVMATTWAIASWATAPAETRIYYPLIMIVGALTMGYCLASIRHAALCALFLMIVPLAIMLFSTGDRMDAAAGTAFLIAGVFQLFMLDRHHALLVELLEHKAEARTLSRLDPLTGLLNRRAFLDDGYVMGAQGDAMRLMLVDIDNFKAVNDRYGHDKGDEVLRRVAQLMLSHARGDVAVARIGGEEFALLGSKAQLDAAVALQLVEEVRSTAMPHGDVLTVSVGVAEGSITDEPSWRRVYETADRALYVAKREGRDQVQTGQCPPLEDAAQVTGDAKSTSRAA